MFCNSRTHQRQTVQFNAALLFCQLPECISFLFSFFFFVAHRLLKCLAPFSLFYPDCQISLNILNVSLTLKPLWKFLGAILSFSHQRCTLSKLKWISPCVYTAAHVDLLFPQPSSSPSHFCICNQTISQHALQPLFFFPTPDIFIKIPFLSRRLDLSLWPPKNVGVL